MMQYWVNNIGIVISEPYKCFWHCVVYINYLLIEGLHYDGQLDMRKQRAKLKNISVVPYAGTRETKQPVVIKDGDDRRKRSRLYVWDR